MAEGGGLINFGDLSKPATVLIEKVSDAVGGIAKPWQIKRVARAEAEAAKIKAIAQVEIDEIEERGLIRLIREQGIHQENIENITAGAIPHLKDGSKPEAIEDDMLAHFFERGRIVSSHEMQQIWSKMLAQEANKPGTLSRKTVDIVSTMSKDDALIFTRFCSFVWHFGEFQPLLTLEDVNENKYNFTFSELLKLCDLGLTTYSPLGFHYRLAKSPFHIQYYGRFMEVFMDGNPPFTFDRGPTMLTTAGQQLVPICGSLPNFTYFDNVMQNWLFDQSKRLAVAVEAKAGWLAT